MLDDRTLGDADAPVVVEVFFDFQSPFAARFYDDVKPFLVENYIPDGSVMLVLRHFPLPFHNCAEPAAIASQCAAEQGMFFEFADELFMLGGRPSSDEGIVGAASIAFA